MKNKDSIISRKTLFSILGIFLLIALFFSSEKFLINVLKEREQYFWENFVSIAVRWLTWGFITVAILKINQLFPLEKGCYRKSFFIHSLLMTVVVFIQPVVYYFYLISVYVNHTFANTNYLSYVVSFLHLNILAYWVILGTKYLFDYQKKYREREIIATKLEAQLVQAQLDVLKTQLQPHFLFNTLNAISALIHEDVHAADKMLTRLSDLLRMTLDKSNVQCVSLKEELEFLNVYLEIQKTRFQERLNVTMDIAPETLDASVPNMILQPVIENAIRHGIAPKGSGGKLSIKTNKNEDTLIITVIDDGKGISTDINPKSKGYGLYNTKMRLSQLYGERYIFDMTKNKSGKSGVQVIIHIPYRTAEDPVS